MVTHRLAASRPPKTPTNSPIFRLMASSQPTRLNRDRPSFRSGHAGFRRRLEASQGRRDVFHAFALATAFISEPGRQEPGMGRRASRAPLCRCANR